MPSLRNKIALGVFGVLLLGAPGLLAVLATVKWGGTIGGITNYAIIALLVWLASGPVEDRLAKKRAAHSYSNN